MTAAKSFSYENRLAKIVSSKRGKSAEQAIALAEKQVEVMRHPALAHIDEAITEIADLCRTIEAVDDPEVQTLYAASNRVLALAGVFGLAELGTAAYSLCEIVTRMQAAETWNPDMLLVHSNALAALREPDAHTPAERKALLGGLARLAGLVST